MQLYKLLATNSKFNDIRENELLKEHTSFKIGGPADVLVNASSIEEIKTVIQTCKKFGIPLQIIGNGSNILVTDKGIRGVVLKIGDRFNRICIEKNMVIAQGGAKLVDVCKEALENSLEGIEFACGIPGTIGGAIMMNAGAYGGEIRDVTTKVTAMDPEGNIITLNNSEMEFGYRKSSVERLGLVVLEVELTLRLGNKEEIIAKTEDLTLQRESKQPLEWASGGSTFKRPEGYFAGKLIDDSGLRGLRHKDAQVSEKHCGFIINRKDATYDDIMKLVEVVQKTVYDNYKVELEMEVRRIGEE